MKQLFNFETLSTGPGSTAGGVWKTYRGAFHLFILVLLFWGLNTALRFFFYRQVPVYTRGGAFFTSSIVLSSINKLGFFMAVALTLAPLVVQFKALKWKKFECPNVTRFLVFAAALPLSWLLLTESYNYVFQQWYLVDRGILLASWLLILFHPLFVLPYLVSMFALLSQFTFGPTHFMIIFYNLSIFYLVMFFSYLYLRTVFEVELPVLFVAVLTLVGVTYFTMGWAKIMIGDYPLQWPLNVKLELGVMTFRYMGWMQSYPAVAKDFVYRVVALFRQPLAVGAFFMECLAFLLVFHRNLSHLFLSLFLVFHVSAYIMFGVLFWPWMIVVAVTIVTLVLLPEKTLAEMFRVQFVLSALLAMGFLFVTGTINNRIGWWDVRSTYSMSLIGTTSNQETFQLNRSSFAPYDRKMSFVTTQDFLIDRKFLGFSAKFFARANAINTNLKSRDDFEEIRQRHGLYRYSETHEGMFKELLRNMVTNHRATHEEVCGTFCGILRSIRAPYVFYMSYDPTSRRLEDLETDLDSIGVRFREGFFNGSENITVSRRTLTEIDLED